MGLFGKIFKKDPRKELEKAESLLAKGQEEKALEVSQRVADSKDLDSKLADRAAKLMDQARTKLVSDYLERADFCEKNQQPGPAAEWCETALSHVQGTARDELIERIETLREREEIQAAAPDPDAPVRKKKVESPLGHEGVADVDFETHFYTLTGMLNPDYAEKYESHSSEFHQAYVMLNEGNAKDALDILEQLAAERPEDEIVLLERGRARMLAGDFAGALEDFDKLWGVFGADYLDLAESMALPHFWADALLQLEEPQRIVEKGDPFNGLDPAYVMRFAEALDRLNRLDEAETVLFEAARRFGNIGILPFRLALVMKKNGEWEKAVHVLEDAIAPTCKTGCATPPKHVDSLRLLADLYIDHDTHLERADELLTLIRQERRGRLSEMDLMLHIKYYSHVGDDTAAAKAKHELEALMEQGPVEETAAVLPKIRTVDSTPI